MTEEPLSCPLHPDGAEDGCAACDVILNMLTSELEQVDDVAAVRAVSQPLRAPAIDKVDADGRAPRDAGVQHPEDPAP